VTRDTLTRLTFGTHNFAPVWTPDGKRVTFQSRANPGNRGISWAPADGSGSPEELFASETQATPGSWLPDGSALAFYQGAPGRYSILLLPAAAGAGAAERKPRPFLGNARLPQISPDGRWIAYASDDSGAYQVYVQPFPGPGGKYQISPEGGDSPRWARSGRELFYRNVDKMMAVDIEAKAALHPGRPKFLFEGHYLTSPPGLQPGPGYDVSPDGKRFLMIKAGSEQPATTQLQVVQDWFEELKRRVPAGSK
jgi:Tol biopolymer transport system component